MIARIDVPRAWMWSAWQPDRGMNFNSYLFERDAGAVAVDPLPLDTDSLQWLESRGGVKTIVLTNRDHQRDAQTLRDRFGSRIVAPQGEAQLFGIPIDATFAESEQVFEDAFAIALPHGKTPGEVALHLRSARAAVVGDALIGAPAGSLGLLPDAKLEDPLKFVLTLRKLWALQLQALLLCDGTPIFRGADAVLGELLESRGGAEVNRINVDELYFQPDFEHPRFQSEDGEVGLFIGARKLGYRVTRIPPGKAFCPLHSHEINEEFFYVMEGNPSIRTLRGTIRCRPGDFIAFPLGERGTHQVRNDTDAPCLVLLVGGQEATEICLYPDSQKVLIASEQGLDRMVRSAPELDYFDGE